MTTTTSSTEARRNAVSPAQRARLAGWLHLAARGWALFPVLPGRKRPAISRWQDRATTDPDRLTRFFTTHPDHNAGIACGPSGLLVIDCDTPTPDDPSHAGNHGRDGWAVLGELAADHDGLPDTWTVTTPSGGRHLYFRLPPPTPDRPVFGNTSRTLGPMLDTRGPGGQVLAPGSRLPHGGYALLDDTTPADLPGWLYRRLSDPAAPTVSAPADPAAAAPSVRVAYIAAAVHAELQRVTTAPRGGHNTAVFTAARALGQLVGAGLLDRTRVEHDLTTAAHHIITGPCDCTARDITASIASGVRYGERRPRHLPPAPRHDGRHPA